MKNVFDHFIYLINYSFFFFNKILKYMFYVDNRFKLQLRYKGRNDIYFRQGGFKENYKDGW